MSELKVYKPYANRDGDMFLYHRGDEDLMLDDEDEIYLKSDVDRVLAEKDKEIAELKESIGKLLKSKTEQIMDEVLEKVIIYGDGFVPVEHAMKLVAEIRHYKYKWLLMMVEWCESRSNKLFEDTLYVRDMGLEPSDELTFKLEFFRKWYARWLKIAEKFKEK